MQKYQSSITTTTGAAIRNVPVTVLKEDGALAELFMDRAGAVPAANPLVTDSRGVFYFYAVNGRYSLRTSVDGVTITDADSVLMNDPEEIATAGPIAEAVAAAQLAAQQAQSAVEDSGIPELVSQAQNAVIDAHAALQGAQSAAQLADDAKTQSTLAKSAAENAGMGAAAAKAAAESAQASAEGARDAAKAYADSIDPVALNQAIDLKVEKVPGKGLSDNNFTNEEHLKLANIATGATKNRPDAETATAASVAQAIAGATTYETVPTVFVAPLILVVRPHERWMQWSAAIGKYVRSVFHQPCQLFFSYDNPPSIPGALPVRADSTWQQSQFPDVVARLGLSGGGTFTLIDARGEYLRVLDNGRGVDVGRQLRSAQGDAGRNLTGTAGIVIGNDTLLTGVFRRIHANPFLLPDGAWHGTSSADFDASRQWPTAAEFRTRSVAFPLWMTI